MTDEIYRKLARRLDTIPNGFPSTESGVELRLLAKLFKPEEAALAGEMRLSLEPAEVIAGRTNMTSEEAYPILKRMVRKGLIRGRKKSGELRFALLPFVVGFYEEQLPRMDAELAKLFEQYFQETQGGVITREKPAVHRVIPINESIPFELEIHPFEQASQMLEQAKSWGVRECICRVQQKLIGKGCDHPVENCLVFAPVEHAFDHAEFTRAITKEEALQILKEAEMSGLVHSTANYRLGNNYICNCCVCCCGILRALAEFDSPTAVTNSGFWAVVDQDICSGCADCIDICPVNALSVPDGVCEVDHARCLGCGLCGAACSTGSIHLERRPESEVQLPPANIKEWMVQRAHMRQIPVQDIM